MLSVADAEKVIAASLPSLPSEDCPLTHAQGRVLRQAVRAERDFPPYDRVMMDGYAVNSAALQNGTHTFEVTATQAAGMMAQRLSEPDHCIEIATGAVLPVGADCIVPYEFAERTGSRVVVVEPETFRSGVHVHKRGSDSMMGDTLLSPGTRLTGRAIAVAASCGVGTLRVSVYPRIAVISTGDELVDVETSLVSPHQIRRSNDHALRAGLLAGGFPRTDRYHFRDVKEEIHAGLTRILTSYDVLLLTGGVSKGKFDFLPAVLSELGVAKKIHGVAQRPGKPFWFGIAPRGTPVFALPGNPVSTYTCFQRYVIPALLQMSGAPKLPPEYATLKAPVSFRAPLAYLVPVKLEHSTDGVRRASAAAPNTSGDFAGIVGSDGFIELPAEQNEFPAGFVARYWPW